MNLEALNEIVNNQENYIESAAKEAGVDEAMLIGVAKAAIGGGYDSLSPKQQYQFDNCLRPLIEDVSCVGYKHEVWEEDMRTECPSTIPEERLVQAYRHDEWYCDNCQAQEDADAHSKEQFMKD